MLYNLLVYNRSAMACINYDNNCLSILISLISRIIQLIYFILKIRKRISILGNA